MASNINIEFSLNSLINKGKIRLVNISVINDAKAAPTPPNKGISKKLSSTFIIHATLYIYLIYFCLPIHTIQEFLATPRYEKAVYQVMAFKIGDAPIYSLPYRILTIKSPKNRKATETITLK